MKSFTNNLFSYSKRSLILIFCLSTIQSVVLFTYGHNWGSDYALYLEQTKALVDEWGINGHQSDENESINPLDQFMENTNYYAQAGGPPATYPWGLSLLFAPIYALFGLNLIYYKILNVILLQLLTVSIFLIRTESKEVKLWVYLLLSGNVYLHHYTNNLVSDLPFLVFSNLSIILLHNLYQGYRLRNIDYILLILSMILSLLIRSNGMLLIIPLFGYLGILLVRYFSDQKELNKSSLQALLSITIVIIAVFGIFGLIKNILPSNESNYLDFMMGANISTIGINLRSLIPVLSDIYFVQTDQINPTILTIPLLIITLIPVTVGIKKYWNEYKLPVLYLLATLCLYILWPYEIKLRFLFPILPFYFLFMVKGWLYIMDSYSIQRFKYIPLYLYILYMIGITSVITIYQNYIYDSTLNGPTGEPSQSIYNYLEKSSDSHEIIAGSSARIIRLYTERKTLEINDERVPLESRYVLYNKNRDARQSSLFQEQTKGFTVIYENEHYMVFEKLSAIHSIY